MFTFPSVVLGTAADSPAGKRSPGDNSPYVCNGHYLKTEILGTLLEKINQHLFCQQQSSVV
jgi:hypothetical protein